MASKNFHRKINIKYHGKVVDKNCLYFHEPIKNIDRIEDMKRYCFSNFGEQRGSHPLNELLHGWQSNIEGDWASSWFHRYNAYVFWFKNTEDKVLFNLTFRD
jgi:hypothetical protein